MWANILSAIGKGAVSGLTAAGKGIKKGATAIVDRIDDGDDEMVSPGFVPPASARPRQVTPALELPELPGQGRAVPMATPPIAPQSTRPRTVTPDYYEKQYPDLQPSVRNALAGRMPDGSAPPTPPRIRGTGVQVSTRPPASKPMAQVSQVPSLPPAANLDEALRLPTQAIPPGVPAPADLGKAPAPEPPTDYRGRPIEDSIAFQRDQWMRPRGTMQGGELRVERNPDGSPRVSYEGGKFTVRRSLKDALINAGIGFMGGALTSGDLAGAIGGALAGGVGTAIDPLRGQEFRFDTLERPRIETEQQRQRTSRRQRAEDAIQQATVDAIPRKARLEEAQIKATETQAQVALDNAQRQRALTESQIALNNARKQAIETGKPRFEDIFDPETGEIHSWQFLPDGTVIDRGKSARAVLADRKIKSNERIAGLRSQTSKDVADINQAGANTRQERAIKAASERQEREIRSKKELIESLGSRLRRPGASPSAQAQTGGAKVATKAHIDYYIEANRKANKPLTRQQAIEILKSKGYQVQDR